MSFHLPLRRLQWAALGGGSTDGSLPCCRAEHPSRHVRSCLSRSGLPVLRVVDGQASQWGPPVDSRAACWRFQAACPPCRLSSQRQPCPPISAPPGSDPWTRVRPPPCPITSHHSSHRPGSLRRRALPWAVPAAKQSPPKSLEARFHAKQPTARALVHHVRRTRALLVSSPPPSPPALDLTVLARFPPMNAPRSALQ